MSSPGPVRTYWEAAARDCGSPSVRIASSRAATSSGSPDVAIRKRTASSTANPPSGVGEWSAHASEFVRSDQHVPVPGNRTREEVGDRGGISRIGEDQQPRPRGWICQPLDEGVRCGGPIRQRRTHSSPQALPFALWPRLAPRHRSTRSSCNLGGAPSRSDARPSACRDLPGRSEAWMRRRRSLNWIQRDSRTSVRSQKSESALRRLVASGTICARRPAMSSAALPIASATCFQPRSRGSQRSIGTLSGGKSCFSSRSEPLSYTSRIKMGKTRTLSFGFFLLVSAIWSSSRQALEFMKSGLTSARNIWARSKWLSTSPRHPEPGSISAIAPTADQIAVFETCQVAVELGPGEVILMGIRKEHADGAAASGQIRMRHAFQ